MIETSKTKKEQRNFQNVGKHRRKIKQEATKLLIKQITSDNN